MKTSKTKKRFVLSLVAVIACVAMLVGTTMAWFTDSVTSGKNKIVAGNLDIDVKHTSASVTTEESISGKDNLFRDAQGNAMLWEPGAISYENFSVQNLGNLALKYKLGLNITDYNALNGHTLKEVLKVKVLEGTDILDSVTREEVMSLDWNTSDTLDVFNKSGVLYTSNDPGASTEAFQVIVYWQPTENDNNYNVNNGQTTSDEQPLFIEFGIDVVATQLDYENDSFGPDYDKNLLLPDLPKSINKVFQSDPIPGSEVSESVIVKNKSTNTGVATMQKQSVNTVIHDLVNQATDKKPDSDLSTVIYLSVATTARTETAITYDVSLSAVLTYTDTDGASKTTEIENLDDHLGGQIVKAQMEIGKKLKDVTVAHIGVPMGELSSEDEALEGFFYNSESGVLTINSAEFSPFTVSYTIEGTCSIGNTIYGSLKEAMNAAQDDDVITMLKDSEEVGLITIPQNLNVTLNLNGHNVATVGDSKGRWAQVDGNLTVTGKGYLGDVTHESTGYLFYVNGTLTLNSPATFESGLEVAEARSATAKIYVKDGYYIGGTYDNRYWHFNKLDSCANRALIEVTGGRFKNFDPEMANTENPVQNWVKSGYYAEYNSSSETYTVKANPADYFIRVETKASNGPRTTVFYNTWAEAAAAATDKSEAPATDVLVEVNKSVTAGENDLINKSNGHITLQVNKNAIITSTSGTELLNANPNCTGVEVRGEGSIVCSRGTLVNFGNGGVTISGVSVKAEQLTSNGVSSLTITGGKYERTDNTKNFINSSPVTIDDTAKFNFDITAYAGPGKACEKEGDWYHLADLSETNAAFKVVNGGTTTYYGATAGYTVEKQKAGDTIMLLKDLTGDFILAKNNVTLDLNNKTLSFNGNSAVDCEGEAENIMIKSGIIAAMNASSPYCIRIGMNSKPAKKVTINNVETKVQFNPSYSLFYNQNGASYVTQITLSGVTFDSYLKSNILPNKRNDNQFTINIENGCKFNITKGFNTTSNNETNVTQYLASNQQLNGSGTGSRMVGAK